MKKKILIGILIVFTVIASIFVIFTLSKKDEKAIIPANNSSTSSTSVETSEVTTEETTLVTEESTTTGTTTAITTTKKLETTKKTTTKKSTTTLDYKTVKETKSEETTKYGVIIKTNYEITYKVYNDGRKEEISKKKKATTYDSTNFKATTAELKPEATAVKNSNNSTYDEMLTYVNNYRSEVNVGPLSNDSNLNLAATIRAMEMAYSNKFSHTRPDGSDCFSVLDDLDINSYYSWGENIAYGQRTVAAVSQAWKKSEGHYKNMINSNFKKVGFGKFTLNGYIYWVQMFAS